MKRVRIPILLTILVYVVFHVTEEALGNFPLFMHENWGIPDIGYAQWLYHNIVFFLPVLLVAFLIFLINEERFLPIGLGISIWGTLNFFEHAFYTIKNASVAPGLFSSLLFVALTIITFVLVRKSGRLTLRVIGLSVVAAVVSWGISLGFVFILAPHAGKIFA
ncbi:MAG: hypothetical protein JW780_03975 [Clostridiales bacterium]|nr:hypothetical protein [Clostridiales bacterium]